MTPRELRISKAWLVVQGAPTPADVMLTTGFYRELLAGTPATATEYSRFLKQTGPVVDAKKRVTELAGHLKAALKDQELLADFRAPVYLRHDGRFELRDGHHRVGMLLALGADSVPCTVIGVDPLFSAMAALTPDRLYQPVDHPWFDGREVLWQTKIETVKAHLQELIAQGAIEAEGYALDVGCYSGGMTRALRKAGYTTYGIDNDSRMLKVASYLDLITGAGAVYVEHDLRQSVPIMAMWPRQVTTLLSVFHHFLGTAEDIAAASRMLQVCANYSQTTIIDLPGDGEAWIQRLPEVANAAAVEAFYCGHFRRHTVRKFAEIQGRIFLSITRDRA